MDKNLCFYVFLSENERYKYKSVFLSKDLLSLW